MKKTNKIKHNYAFVFYDIKEQRCQKVFKICKKYFSHHQLSVFRGKMTPSNLKSFENEIKKVIVPEEDMVSIITVLNENSFQEHTIGTKVKTGEDLFL
jgi:CRISPR-associated protein Cas2